MAADTRLIETVLVCFFHTYMGIVAVNASEIDVGVVFEPNQIRSRFAAFDPTRTKEADILAGLMPLGLLADEEVRRKLDESLLNY